MRRETAAEYEETAVKRLLPDTDRLPFPDRRPGEPTGGVRSRGCAAGLRLPPHSR
jgi:hypothetical protein